MEPELSRLYQIFGEAVALFYHGAPQCEMRQTANAWLVSTGEPLVDFNTVFIDQGPHAAEQLQTFHRHMVERQLPALYMFTAAVADQLAATAQTLGIQQAGRAPVMVCQATNVHPTLSPYTIRPVKTAEQLAAVCQVIAGAFNLPLAPMQRVLGEWVLQAPAVEIFLAYRGDEPVSTVTIIPSGPIVGVWAMATAPAQQRQGAGRALLAHVLAQQGGRGTQWFYLWATAAGQPLYEQIGFRTVSELSVWATGHSTQGLMP